MNGDSAGPRSRSCSARSRVQNAYSPKLPHQLQPAVGGDRLGHHRERRRCPSRSDPTRRPRRRASCRGRRGTWSPSGRRCRRPTPSAGRGTAWPPCCRRPAGCRRRGRRRRGPRGRRPRPTGWRRSRCGPAGSGRDRRGVVGRVARRDERRRDAEAGERGLQQRARAAVELGRRHDVVPGGAQRGEHEQLGGLAARRGHGADAALEAGHALLERGDGRVADAGCRCSRTSAARTGRRRRRRPRTRSSSSGRSGRPGRPSSGPAAHRRGPPGCGTPTHGPRRPSAWTLRGHHFLVPPPARRRDELDDRELDEERLRDDQLRIDERLDGAQPEPSSSDVHRPWPLNLKTRVQAKMTSATTRIQTAGGTRPGDGELSSARSAVTGRGRAGPSRRASSPARTPPVKSPAAKSAPIASTAPSQRRLERVRLPGAVEHARLALARRVHDHDEVRCPLAARHPARAPRLELGHAGVEATVEGSFGADVDVGAEARGHTGRLGRHGVRVELATRVEHDRIAAERVDWARGRHPPAATIDTAITAHTAMP